MSPVPFSNPARAFTAQQPPVIPPRTSSLRCCSSDNNSSTTSQRYERKLTLSTPEGRLSLSAPDMKGAMSLFKFALVNAHERRGRGDETQLERDSDRVEQNTGGERKDERMSRSSKIENAESGEASRAVVEAAVGDSRENEGDEGSDRDEEIWYTPTGRTPRYGRRERRTREDGRAQEQQEAYRTQTSHDKPVSRTANIQEKGSPPESSQLNYTSKDHRLAHQCNSDPSDTSSVSTHEEPQLDTTHQPHHSPKSEATSPSPTDTAPPLCSSRTQTLLTHLRHTRSLSATTRVQQLSTLSRAVEITRRAEEAQRRR